MEKFVSPFEKEFEAYQKEVDKEMKKMQWKLDLIDRSLHPVVDFTREFGEPAKEENSRPKKQTMPDLKVLTERNPNQPQNYSFAKDYKAAIEESVRLRNSMFFRESNLEGKTSTQEKKACADFCLLSLDPESD